MYAGLLDRCNWAAAAFPFRAGDTAAVKTAPAFVDAAAELLAPLLAGVPLVRSCICLRFNAALSCMLPICDDIWASPWNKHSFEMCFAMTV